MVKKLLTWLSAFTICAVLLCGCAPPSRTGATELSTTPSAPDAQAQIQLLIQHQQQWDQTHTDDVLPFYYYHYAVTDLDRNGRLEMLAMSTQGTGIFTYGTVYEVNQDFTGLEPCTYLGDDGCSLPELIMTSVPAGYDPASGTYHYVFQDNFRVGAAEYGQAIMPLSLHNGVVTFQTLGRMHAQVADGVTREEYYRADPAFIAPKADALTADSLQKYQNVTAAEYEQIIPTFLNTLQSFTANFEWFQVEDTADEVTLAKSWEVFRSSWN